MDDAAGGLLAHRIRAGALAFLSGAGEADFTALAAALAIAHNSLSGHLQRLEAAGMVELRRGFKSRKPCTRVVLTRAGRDAWVAYLDRLS